MGLGARATGSDGELTLQQHMLDKTAAAPQHTHKASRGAVSLVMPFVQSCPATLPLCRTLPATQLMPERSPLLFIDVRMPEQRDGSSYANPHEAAVVAHVCASLIGVLPGKLHHLQRKPEYLIR
jgi:hypothetical protein